RSEPVPHRVRAQSQDPVRGGDGRGGDDVSRVPQAARAAAATVKDPSMNQCIRAIAALAAAGFCTAAVAQAPQNFDAVKIDTLKVRDNIYMLVGSGGN